MSPLPPSADTVETVTLLDASCVVNVVTFRLDGVVVVSEKVPPPNAIVSVLAAALMVMLVGSSNSVPPSPAGARVSTKP